MDRNPSRDRQRRHQPRGQSVVEFALVVPLLLLLLIAIADFGRFYVSAVAVESAAREAADFGAFDNASNSNWSPTNAPTTTQEMERRACVAAAGSHLEGYASSDPSNRTCTNPTFTCTLEVGAQSADCATSGGIVGTSDCSQPTTEPPCTVHVALTYQFRTLLALPPMPSTVQIVRNSRFQVSTLTTASPAPSASP
jgi:Flp pilus assembly protein TadG